MRLKGYTKASKRAIKAFLSTLPNALEVPSKDVAALHMSQAVNHAYNFRFQRHTTRLRNRHRLTAYQDGKRPSFGTRCSVLAES